MGKVVEGGMVREGKFEVPGWGVGRSCMSARDPCSISNPTPIQMALSTCVTPQNASSVVLHGAWGRDDP